MTEAPDIHSTPFDTIRSDCGFGRATYRPDYGVEKPWIAAFKGTVFNHFPTKPQAVQALRVKGCKFKRADK